MRNTNNGGFRGDRMNNLPARNLQSKFVIQNAYGLENNSNSLLETQSV